VNDVDRIIRIAARGDGVTADGRHVPMSAPGDRLLSDGGLALGPDHVTPPCRHFPECGGCQLQHLSDRAYAAYVQDRVAGALLGQGLDLPDIRTAHISPPGSRRRAALRVVRAGKRIEIGFSTQSSHRIVDMQECLVLTPALFALVEPLRAMLAPHLRDRQSMRVTLALVDQGVDCAVEGVLPEGLEATERWLEFARNHKLARLIMGEDEEPLTLWEPEPATVTLGGHSVGYPAHAFLQATADGEAALMAAVRESVGEATTVADLFSGLGTFAMTLAGPGRKVYAAEAARPLLMALQAAGNRRPGTVFAEHRDLFRRPLTAAECNRFDAIVLDPPRAGAQEQVAELATAKVPVLTYVSCNPATFARDAKALIAGGYRLDWVQPVGQFRWSTHVELAARFVRQ
jgi:23S rRNA (uracil1939-C5)-methyltransferase